jgi:hypothetical protein|tara:strand:+ start:1272 stop:1892 length:621 start_codon:yes stop_codon:yes gene_type:complete
MTDNPKVMFNQGEGKFTAMDPKDDNLVNKIYNSKDPVKEVDKLVNETKPASSVAEYYKQQSEIKKFNSLDRSTYPSDPKQRNRLKAMSTWDAMKEVAKEEARKGNYKDLRELRKIERNAMKKKKGPFEQSLDNVINKPKKITTNEIPITEQSIKQLSQDINAYVNRKEKERKPVVVKRPVIKQPNRMTGPFGSDTFYLRFIKGIKD